MITVDGSCDRESVYGLIGCGTDVAGVVGVWPLFLREEVKGRESESKME